jgi:hypothetical protein
MRFGADVPPSGDWYHAQGVDTLLDAREEAIEEARREAVAWEREEIRLVLKKLPNYANSNAYAISRVAADEAIRSRGAKAEKVCRCPDGVHLVYHSPDCPLYEAPAKPLEGINVRALALGGYNVSEELGKSINALVDAVNALISRGGKS